MSVFPVSLESTPKDVIPRLRETLAAYKAVSGLTSQQVLVKKGRDLSFAAYAAYKSAVPAPGSILSRLKGLGWASGRKGPGSIDGISETAYERARARMGGHKSVLAAVIEEAGRITVRTVRIGKRGRRVIGGRRGIGGVVVAGRDWINRQSGDIVLNFRAMQTIEEVNLREAGRRFLAVSFLYRRWLTQGAGPLKQRNLVNLNPRSKIGYGALGSVSMEGEPDNDETQALRISSFVPGAAQIGESRGLLARALFDVRDDMEVYLRRKHEEALDAEVKKAMK